jgi:hypothetical protein
MEIGSVVATVVGTRDDTLDRTAARRLLLHRLTEDYGYQAVVRATATDATAARERLQPILDSLDPEWAIEDVGFPRNRSFETSRWRGRGSPYYPRCRVRDLGEPQ